MNILTIKNLNFSYKDKCIINNSNLCIETGDIVGLIGENGAGKSTLMKLISGIMTNYSGEIIINSKNIGILIEDPYLYRDLSVIRNLKFFCRLYNKDFNSIDSFIKLLDISSYLNKKVSKLSLGMKQRVGICVALIASNEFILLDEPTNGLDPRGIFELLNLIKELSKKFGITFIISSHILENLEKICNKNILLRNRKIISLDSEKYLKYRISSFEVSQFDLIKYLENEGYEYEVKGGEIIVSNINEIEKFFYTLNINIKKEKLSLSEVYFDEERV